MGQIKICFSAVQIANTELNKTTNRLEALADDLELLRKRLDSRILVRHQIDAGLISCRTSASAACTKAKKLYNIVGSGLEKYQAAESQLSRSTPDDSKVRG